MFNDKKPIHRYVVIYEDYRGEIFEDNFETEADTIKEAKELFLDDSEDIYILSFEEVK